MQAAIKQLRREGGEVLVARAVARRGLSGRTLCATLHRNGRPDFKNHPGKTFAPILYLMSYRKLTRPSRGITQCRRGLSSANLHE